MKDCLDQRIHFSLVTRDSPKGLLCSSALRGIYFPTSPCVTISSQKNIVIADQAQEIKGDPDAADERKLLTDYLALSESEATGHILAPSAAT